jgi:recombination associated protein RdgC
MFKNLTIHRAVLPEGIELSAVEAALQAGVFVPCAATQDKSVGWVPPREEHGPLIESIAGEWIAAFMVEIKSVPASAVQKKADEAAAEIETTQGRKPGRKEMKTLKEDALLALLPTAHPKQTRIAVWIDRQNKRLIADTVSQARLDDLSAALVTAMPELQLSNLNTQITPQTAMTGWLATTDTADWPEGFAVERECELKSGDEEKSVVRYSRHHLLTEEVRNHLQQGKRPTRLAMSWEGRVAFTLTENLQLRKLAFLDGVFDGEADKDQDHFDADVAISTGELHKLLPALIDALGGELLPGEFPRSEHKVEQGDAS